MIEETSLIPEFLPRTWMTHINRYAKGLHPLSKRYKGAEEPKKRNSVGVSERAKGTPSKGTPAKASRKVAGGAESSNGWTSQNNPNNTASVPYSSSNYTQQMAAQANKLQNSTFSNVSAAAT